MFYLADQVFEFFKEVLRSCFPFPFWGSTHNFEMFTQTLKTFLNLRRKDKFPCKSITRGIRVTDIHWVAGISDDDNVSYCNVQLKGNYNKHINENSSNYCKQDKEKKQQ